MADNPSVVSDASGGNYSGILDQTNLASAANMSYLENLWELAQKAAPNTPASNPYRPSAGEGVKVGGISNQTLGSVDLFASGLAKIPFEVLDQMEKAKQDAEAKYYKEVKTYLDKPIADITAKLNNPFAQKDFVEKIQGTMDAYLDSYANRFGGDYMKAYAAAVSDPNLKRTMALYQNYADAYNMVFTDVVDLLKKSANPTEYYVPDEMKQRANRFLQNHGDMKNLSIDKLAQNIDQFKEDLSIYKIVQTAMKDFKDSVYESYPYKDTNISTDEEDVYIQKTVTGKEGGAQSFINSIVEAHPWIKSDPIQMSLLTSLVTNSMKHDVKYAISKVKKDSAERTLDLKKYGIMNDKGEIQFNTKPAALVNTLAYDAVNYPKQDKPIPTTVGAYAYFINNGKLCYGKLPESYQMIPVSEYDIRQDDKIVRGRYVEGKIAFQSSQPFKPEQIRTASSQGVLTDARKIGEGRGTTEVVPTKIFDELSGSEISVFGETTVLMPFEQMKGQIAGAIPHMSYVHEKLDEKRGGVHMKAGTPEVPIGVTEDTDLSDINNSPLVYYRLWNGNVMTGQAIHNMYTKK